CRIVSLVMQPTWSAGREGREGARGGPVTGRWYRRGYSDSAMRGNSGQGGAVVVAVRCARPGDDGDRPGFELFAAVRAHRDRVDHAPAAGVPDLQGRSVERRPPAAPLPHRGHPLPQIPALAGEPVLRAGRVVLVGNPLEHAAVDQMAQPPGEDVARDPEAG